MKNRIQNVALIGAVFCIIAGLAPAPAHAFNVTIDENVRAAQMRLSDLGYRVGPYDGVLGSETRHALAEFQHVNRLPENGRLTRETFDLLLHTDYLAHHPYYYPTAYQHGYNYNYAYNPSGYINPTTGLWTVDWQNRWYYVYVQHVPSRFGSLDIHEDDRGSLRQYTVTLNGQAILFANNQPAVLRVSRTFEMNGEDAVIFSAYSSEDGCAYKNYLLTLRSNGTYTGPHMIGNCSSSYEAYVSNDETLMMSFPDRKIGWGPIDMWRYQDGVLMRI